MPRPFAPRTIVLRSPDARDFVRIAAVRTDSGYPSLEVRVEGMARGFAGGGEAWLDGFELKAFTTSLRAFERSRQGTLELGSMSPGEFRLVLRSLDHAGQLLVEFAISKNARVGDGPEVVPIRVSGAFELDPGTLGEILGGFVQLENAVAR